MQRAADWVAEQFRGMGFAAEVIPTAGHPLVYAESPPVPGAPTVLVYGHYDVQPAEPLELWITPPFEPARRDGQSLRPRGQRRQRAGAHAHQERRGLDRRSTADCRCKLKYLIEGEEEVGSARAWRRSSPSKPTAWPAIAS